MRLRLGLWIFPSCVLVATGGITLGPGFRAEEDCCPCQESGDEHEFNGLCSLCVEDPPYGCMQCEGGRQPEGHSGCHANTMNGDCFDHVDCIGSSLGGGALNPLALSYVLAANNEAAALEIISQAKTRGRVFVSLERDGIQLLDCDRQRVIGHYTVTKQVLDAAAALQ